MPTWRSASINTYTDTYKLFHSSRAPGISGLLANKVESLQGSLQVMLSVNFSLSTCLVQVFAFPRIQNGNFICKFELYHLLTQNLDMNDKGLQNPDVNLPIQNSWKQQKLEPIEHQVSTLRLLILLFLPLLLMSTNDATTVH